MFELLLYILTLISTNAELITLQETKQVANVNNCELNVLRLHDANAAAGKDDLIIVIARLGKGDRSREVNRRRLHNVKTYLVEFLGRPPKTIVLAEGERKNGLGSIDLYVRGKLADTLELGAGEDLLVGSCDNTSPGDAHFFNSSKRDTRPKQAKPRNKSS